MDPYSKLKLAKLSSNTRKVRLETPSCVLDHNYHKRDRPMPKCKKVKLDEDRRCDVRPSLTEVNRFRFNDPTDTCPSPFLKLPSTDKGQGQEQKDKGAISRTRLELTIAKLKKMCEVEANREKITNFEVTAVSSIGELKTGLRRRKSLSPGHLTWVLNEEQALPTPERSLTRLEDKEVKKSRPEPNKAKDKKSRKNLIQRLGKNAQFMRRVEISIENRFKEEREAAAKEARMAHGKMTADDLKDDPTIAHETNGIKIASMLEEIPSKKADSSANIKQETCPEESKETKEKDEIKATEKVVLPKPKTVEEQNEAGPDAEKEPEPILSQDIATQDCVISDQDLTKLVFTPRRIPQPQEKLCKVMVKAKVTEAVGVMPFGQVTDEIFQDEVEVEKKPAKIAKNPPKKGSRRTRRRKGKARGL